MAIICESIDGKSLDAAIGLARPSPRISSSLTLTSSSRDGLVLRRLEDELHYVGEGEAGAQEHGDGAAETRHVGLHVYGADDRRACQDEVELTAAGGLPEIPGHGKSHGNRCDQDMESL